ncbi:MAG: FprA family A-type flavoprotein [Fastidiosipilaceae bacterium]|jgi:flavorubredoxin
MPIQPICNNVLEVGASHPDRQLFDALMPTPFGTTYNSYLVIGEEATALIDPVDPEKAKDLIYNLKEAGVEKLDYIIILHTEQDHSGTTPLLQKLYPEAKLVGTKKVQELMESHLHIPPSDFLTVAEGDQLDLGGKLLTFYPIPFAHWPDNTACMLEEDRVLFSSDLFGSHYADTKVFSTSGNDQRIAARNYFAEIMMPFRAQCAKYTKKFREMAPNLVAPSHGPVWYDPRHIFDLYESWTNNKVRRSVVIGYVSMHESTEKIVEALTLNLNRHGLSVVCRNIAEEPSSLMLVTGHVASDLVDAAAFILGTPTVLGGPHPAAAYAAILVNALKPKNRYFGVVGSFGWATKAADTIEALTGSYKAERLEPLLIKGLPTEEDYQTIKEYADDLAEKILALEDVIT